MGRAVGASGGRQEGAAGGPSGKDLASALFDSGKTNSDYPLMFAVLIALAVLGIALYYVVVGREKMFAGWAERAPD